MVALLVFYALLSLDKINARGDFPARVMLHHTLMMEYNADLSPPEVPLNVTHDLTLRRVVKFDEGLLELDAWQTLEWTDSRLSWDAGEYGNVTSISLPVTNLWAPDVVQVDGPVQKSTSSRRGGNAVVYDDGRVLYVWQDTLYTYNCVRNNANRVACHLKFLSWTLHGEQLDLHSMQVGDHVDISGLVTSATFYVINATVTRNVVTHACCREPYIDLTYTLWFGLRMLTSGVTSLHGEFSLYQCGVTLVLCYTVLAKA